MADLSDLDLYDEEENESVIQPTSKEKELNQGSSCGSMFIIKNIEAFNALIICLIFSKAEYIVEKLLLAYV